MESGFESLPPSHIPRATQAYTPRRVPRLEPRLRPEDREARRIADAPPEAREQLAELEREAKDG